MKPYGREKKVRFSCKQDCHPPKGWHNWWEDLAECLSRTSMKQAVRKQIENDIFEN